MFSKKIQVLTETIQKLLNCHAEESLKNILSKSHEADIAYVLGQLDPSSQAQVFSLLKDAMRQAQVLSELSLDQASPLLKILGAKQAAAILEQVPPDDVADILEALPNDFSSEILLLLKKEEAEEVEGLIRYSPETAGGIMSPEVFSLPEDWTVAKAIEEVQKKSGVAESVFYLYVVNEQNQLVGVLSLKKLILAPPNTKLQELMVGDPVRVRLNEDQEEVARTVSRYNFLSLPVVDDANKLVGVITVDDVIDVIKEEAAEDMLLMVGLDKAALGKGSLWTSLKKRLPWFLVTLMGGLIASEVIRNFSDAIVRLTLLAGFIPLVLGVGASMGIQSMTVVVGILSLERSGSKRVWGILFREFRLALIVGILYGVLLALFTHFRYSGDLWLTSAAIGSALVLTMVIAVMIGTFIPVMFKRIGFDPAIATAPFVTALVHIFCIWAYFALACYFLKIL